MMPHAPIPYQSLRAHGVVGDRRTAALVAGDGTIDWLCLPDYDGNVVFGALLDAGKGGFWRLGPAALMTGRQAYLDHTALLTTTWELDGGQLELTDFMPRPENDRPSRVRDQHLVLRRLHCTRGQVRCCLHLVPAFNFEPGALTVDSPTQAHFRAGSDTIRLWLSQPVLEKSAGAVAEFLLRSGDECWAVLTCGDPEEDWSAHQALNLMEDTAAYWRRWAEGVNYRGPRESEVRLSARLIHLLSYAPNGSVVAAPTTSLPERIGADWNADYRLTWVRDASLSLAILSMLGKTQDAGRYLEWLSHLSSSASAPLQVVYGPRGERKPKAHERKDLYGYRGSQPVRLGNHAYRQTQHDATGFLVDGAFIYLKQGGPWRSDYTDLLRRVLTHLENSWDRPDNGIWELAEKRNFVSGKVMSWVAFDRAVKIAERLGLRDDAELWAATRDRILAAVLERGWSDDLGAFRQHEDADNLDAAALLIPVMGMLPPGDSRVASTAEQIARRLTCNDLVFRFDPPRTPGVPQPAQPMGEYEGAFLPCTFWLATTYALMGQRDRAEAILRKAESCAGPDGLFSEGVDARTGLALGNFPLLFSHSEYVRAVLSLEEGTVLR